VPQLSELAIRAAKPAAAAFTIWDDATAGFGLRVYPGGAKSFIVLIGSGRRQTIGKYGPGGLTLSEARSEARRILAQKTLGRVRPKHVAFEEARDAFLTEREKTLRPRTLADYRRLLTKHYPYGRSSVGQITPHDIGGRLKKLPPAERHHAFAAGRAFFRFCVSQHCIDRSPMADMEPPSNSRPRERALSDQELHGLCRLVFAPQNHFHRIIALCLLTGQRRGEIARLERSWLKNGLVTIPAHITKNGRTHAFPIGLIARRILETTPNTSDTYFFPAARERVQGKPATVFNGWGKPKAQLDKDLGVYDWTIHDLRRTVSSGMAALGVPQIVVEKLLNHVSGGTQSQIARVYNVYEYQAEMRAAIDAWEQHLSRLIQT
jgi:integrase